MVMAFNPMANFQKYKKIWMTTVILISMVTFVLCSGMGGEDSGLQGIITHAFRGRSDVVATIDGTNYSAPQFRDLKENREIANKYMRKVIEQSANVLQSLLKQPEDLKKVFGDREMTDRDQGMVLVIYRSFVEKLKRPRFFEGSSKLNDLVDFQLFLVEADRLNIHLTDKMISQLVQEETALYIPAQEKDVEPIKKYLLYGEDFAKISQLTRREVQNTSDDRIVRALRDEMRVRIAKMVLLEAPNIQLSELLLSLFRRNDDKTMTPRVSLSPDQWFDYYKKNRATFDVKLVPIDAAALAKTVAAPTAEELLAFFEKHKTLPEDISSAETGLQYPRDRFMVHFLMADPKSRRFKTKAEATLAVQLAPPAIWNPMMPPLFTYLNYPAVDAISGKVILDKIGERSEAKVRDIFGAGRVGDEDYATQLLAWLGRKSPQANAAIGNMVAAGFGGGPDWFASLPLYVQEAKKGKEKLFDFEMARQMEKERETRMPIYTTFMAMSNDPLLALLPAAAVTEPHADLAIRLGGIAHPFLTLEPLTSPARMIPLSLYREEEWDKLVQEKSTEYVRDVMLKARERLTRSDIVGTQSKLDVNLRRVLEEYGLTLVSSKKPYTVYELEVAAEMEPLRKAFAKHSQAVDFFEGRRDDKMLTGKNFAESLFFSSGEKHSVEGRSYTPRAWPPDMEMQQKPELIEVVLAYVEGRPVGGKKLGAQDAEGLEFMMKTPDPRTPKEQVSLFKRSDNPILFWKEDPPKGDPTPRWDGEVRKSLERQIKSLKSDLENRTARLEEEAKANPKIDKAELEKSLAVYRNAFKTKEAELRKKAEEEIQETHARTLVAYKLAEARDKLAPALASKIANELAATGGESVTNGPYGDVLAKLGKDKGIIVLENLARWYRAIKKSGDFEYRDFTITAQDGIPFPRADMAKQLMELPTLEAPIKVGFDAIDDLNKELFEVSKKAFAKLKVEKKTVDTAPRIVQVIPNKPRTMYYIAILTSSENLPNVSLKGFEESISIVHSGAIDPFLERVYQEASKQWQSDVITGLRKRRGVTIETNEASKGFDSDSSN